MIFEQKTVKKANPKQKTFLCDVIVIILFQIAIVGNCFIYWKKCFIDLKNISEIIQINKMWNILSHECFSKQKYIDNNKKSFNYWSIYLWNIWEDNF